MNKPEARFVLYGRPYCHLCDDMLAALAQHMAGTRYALTVIDVDSDPALEDVYGEWVPVLLGGDERLCHYRLDTRKVDEYLRKIG